MVLDASAIKAIEFVDEVTFNTFPTNPTMVGWGGYASPAVVKKTTVPDRFSYLKGVSGTNRLQATETVKVSEAIEIDIEVHPTDWTLLPRILKGATSTTYAIGDTNYDVSFGLKIGTEFEKITGGAFKKFECTIEEDKTVIANVNALAAATSGFTTTYIGTGAHAADPTGNALKFGDMSSITYDAAALSTQNAHLDMVKFGIDYEVKPVRDLESTAASKIGAWAFGQRNITLELGLSLDAMDLAADMLAGAAHTFEYTLGAKTFSFSDVKWMGDFDENLDADDLLGMDLKAEFVSLAIT